MQTAEYNHNDFNTASNEADKALAVKFFLKEVQDKQATSEQGRPIFKELEYIDIRTAGRAHALACRPATLADKNRFPRHYEAFKQRVAMPTEGTPLSEWPQISRTQATELAFVNVKTVEQLIAMADSNAMKFHGGLNLKRKAAEWLEAADATKLIAENQAAKDTIDSLLDRVKALQEQVESMCEEEPAAEATDVPHETVEPVQTAPRRRRKAKG